MGKHRRDRGQERTDKRCGYTWSTRPPPNQVIRGVCYDHWCGLLPNHSGGHVCMKTWDCGETR